MRLSIHNHCATVTIGYTVRGLGMYLCSVKPYRIIYINKKWLNIISQRCIHTISVGQMSMWHPVPFIPPHMKDTEMQGAYQQSKTKGSLLLGGRGSGVDGGELGLRWGRLSSYCTLWYQPRRHYDSCRGGGTYYDILSEKPLAKMPNTNWWKSDILFKDHVGDTQKHASAFPKPDFKFTVYFPRWSCDLLKDVELKLLSICDVRFFSAKACTL